MRIKIYASIYKAKSAPWLRPPLAYAGSTKFDRPQKRKRFWGARTSPTRGALCESPAARGTAQFQPLMLAAARAVARTAAK